MKNSETHHVTGAALCPRCGTPADHSPDDKACSDHCIRRLNEQLLRQIQHMRETVPIPAAVRRAFHGRRLWFGDQATAEREYFRAIVESLERGRLIAQLQRRLHAARQERRSRRALDRIHVEQLDTAKAAVYQLAALITDPVQAAEVAMLRDEIALRVSQVAIGLGAMNDRPA